MPLFLFGGDFLLYTLQGLLHESGSKRSIGELCSRLNGKEIWQNGNEQEWFNTNTQEEWLSVNGY
jgi:calcineurin-like phosphoesterase family protein